MPESKPVRVSWKQVAAFRLSRHRLSKKTSLAALSSVPGDMAGAQAQVLLAGQMSIWPRVKGARLQDVESALWIERTLVRAWGMRGTMFLLPSDELSVFVRGSARRAAYNLNWAIRHAGSKQDVDKLLDRVSEILEEPRTRTDLAQMLTESHGYKTKSKAAGGWGDKRKVPHVKVGTISLSMGFLLHIIRARDVICSGSNQGTEASYVRADKWIKNWKDVSQETAERELLVKYLKAHGPATINDFAIWEGLYMKDAKDIWSKEAENIVEVDIEGSKAGTLESDLPELESAKINEPVVRLVPYFDSFLLGHKSHLNIVDEKNRKKVYRSQGWVSPVLLVDGRAQGVWSHVQKKNDLEVKITPFSKLSNQVTERAKEEASDLGRFLDCSSVKTIFA
ncbi:winged helix DNA-binding domain-containing protein [Candidatus Bathyarchaeota archaeon]|nr:MAG: winged helix DNA-binding domain-containing protein [Candidatus Bathyarchaeota archaeon]